ncbi:hypothetical protein JHK85_045694 [Glycine max]|nr:hypothetical protein JHK85_045694 [Glycine max]
MKFQDPIQVAQSGFLLQIHECLEARKQQLTIYCRTSSVRVDLVVFWFATALIPLEMMVQGGQQLGKFYLFLPIFPILNPHPSTPRRFSSATPFEEHGASLCCQMWINNFYHPNHAITNLSSFLRCFDLWVLTYQKVTTGSYSRCSSLYTSRTSSPSAMSSSM